MLASAAAREVRRVFMMVSCLRQETISRTVITFIVIVAGVPGVKPQRVLVATVRDRAE